MSGPAAFARLIGAAWILIRADALIPREADPILPAGARALGAVLRLFAGPAARGGRPGARLAAALERVGPVGIKLGQFLSTRGDVFGRTFAEDLGRLTDRLEPFPTAIARAEVERALGRPVETVFSRFDDAMASASLAQVHRAVLLDGRAVGVKVLRPGIERRVARDGEALALAARLAERWAPPARRLDPAGFVAVIERALRLELDLRFEAAGADELREAMEADAWMAAPRVVWEGVARRVLTLEWAEGAPLPDPQSLAQPGLDRPRLATALVRAFLAQALDHGLFHADLHEGNLFVAPPARLTAVDFGIVGRLAEAERRYLAEIVWGFLARDYALAADAHFAAGYVGAGQDRAAFAQALRAVGEPVFGRPAAAISMSRLLAQLFEITALFDMRLRPELVLLQKTMATVEGVARRIDPDHDIWAAADPVVRRWMVRELAPTARARTLVREAAREAVGALRALRRAAEAPTAHAPAIRSAPEPTAAPEIRRADTLAPWLAFACGAVASALAFALAAWLR